MLRTYVDLLPFGASVFATHTWAEGGLRLCLLPSVAPGPLFLLRLRYAPAQVCVAKTEANLGGGCVAIRKPGRRLRSNTQTWAEVA
jgi:hypothetical protein